MDDRSRRSRLGVAGACLALIFAASATRAGGAPASAGPTPFAAREGLELASAAAQAWSGDATLVYVENDETLDASGHSTRWGYLFHSASLDKARVWSVRDGKLVVASDLDMRFDAPPVRAGWLDSEAAVAVAEAGGGAEFCKAHGGRLVSMLLVRGALSEGDPDVTTWTFVYSATGSPSLFVVVDATDGKVQRTWKG
jgi:hypothetical protein